MEIIDISNPLHFTPVKSLVLNTTGEPSALAVSGQFAYYGTSQDGAHIIRIWPPDSPVELGRVDTTPWPSSTWGIFLVGDYYFDFRNPFGEGIFKLHP